MCSPKPKTQLSTWSARRTIWLLHSALTTLCDLCGVQRRIRANSCYAIGYFIDEGVFFSSTEAGGFLCVGFERQSRNDECFEPTADLF